MREATTTITKTTTITTTITTTTNLIGMLIPSI